VLSEHGVSFCSPDATTFVAVFSGSEDDRGMRAVLDGLTAEPKAKAADGHVVVTVNALQGSSMSLLPLMIMGPMGGHF
jgi:hypothetical protein